MKAQMKTQKKTQQNKAVAPKKTVKKTAKRSLTTKKQVTKKALVQAPAFAPSFASKNVVAFNSAQLTTMARRNMSGLTGQTFFTKDHEYVRYDSETTAFVGISDHAQHELGEIVYVELPSVGASFAPQEPFGSIESVKSSNNVYAPLDMTVLKVNLDLSNAPQMVNESPYDQGWLAHVEPKTPGQHAGLMSANEYEAYCAAL